MKRFLMLVGIAVLAAAAYVAAAPGSQQAGPTAKQFAALKKQVASLSKTVKSVKTLAQAEGQLLVDCTANGAIPVGQFGDGNQAPTQGYEYSLDATADAATVLTTALDATDPADPNAVFFMGGGTACGTDINAGGLREAAARDGVRLPHRLSPGAKFQAHSH